MIPARSKKRIKEQRIYTMIVKRILAADPECKIRAPGCQYTATGMHHIVKRSPANWLDENNLIAACNSCQAWIENNPLEAIEKGFAKSKFL
jgi:5-methylcytosine-specific restriction endonuclease McrA